VLGLEFDDGRDQPLSDRRVFGEVLHAFFFCSSMIPRRQLTRRLIALG